MTKILGGVTSGCRQRLNAHYGSVVQDWLNQVPEVLAVVARDWSLELQGYHDAGHASVLAVADTVSGDRRILKAWYDRERYFGEIAALRHWEPVNGRVLLARDDANAVACLQMVGEEPGGDQRPADAHKRVASALARLHAHTFPADDLTTLDTYLRSIVDQRTRDRLRRFGDKVPLHCVNAGLGAAPARTQKALALLHADLYQENVLFAAGRPVFLDPLPMLGDPAFDWAFFTVYYDLTSDPLTRLRLASQASGIESCVLAPWCLRLCLDGLLYYHEVNDEREPRMVEVMTALSLSGGP